MKAERALSSAHALLKQEQFRLQSDEERILRDIMGRVEAECGVGFFRQAKLFGNGITKGIQLGVDVMAEVCPVGGTCMVGIQTFLDKVTGDHCRIDSIISTSIDPKFSDQPEETKKIERTRYRKQLAIL